MKADRAAKIGVHLAEIRALSGFEQGWITGIIEGEGSFGGGSGTAITVAMTDRDTVERVAKFFHCNAVVGRRTYELHHKPVFVARICGAPAIALTCKIFNDLSARRQEQALAMLANAGNLTKARLSQAYAN